MSDLPKHRGKNRASIVILEDDRQLARRMQEVLELSQFETVVSYESQTFFEYYNKFSPDVVLLDIRLENSPMDGLEVMRVLRKEYDTGSKIIVISGDNSVKKTNEIRELGAFNFIEKGANFKIEQLVLNVENAIELKNQETENLSLQIENITLRKQLLRQYILIGENDKILEAKEKLKKFAKADEDILVIGETGTGKEIIANLYYNYSSRFGRQFNTVNCSALTEALIESELFGHRKGSFTGADQDKVGLFEKSNGGILFLDEISTLSLPAQAKILRAIEYKEIQVVGGGSKKVDTRLVFASNLRLEEMMKNDMIRSDLFFRTEGNVIELPSLRERGKDILLLMEHFFESFSPKYPCVIHTKLNEIYKDLIAYPWAGNVRELRNFCKNLMIQEAEITNQVILKHLFNKNPMSQHINTSGVDKYFGITKIKEGLDTFEKDYLNYHLQLNHWNVNMTAQILGVDRTTLYKKMERLGIQLERRVRRIRPGVHE